MLFLKKYSEQGVRDR